MPVYPGAHNEHRPHRALDLLPPDGHIALKQASATQLLRRREGQPIKISVAR
jgi:hypothetical protein